MPPSLAALNFSPIQPKTTNGLVPVRLKLTPVFLVHCCIKLRNSDSPACASPRTARKLMICSNK
jgi:hypothetical protein